MKKHHKKQSSYGAVTVFLTLILLPCMIFVCAFGDVSRVLLSKSQAEAASDLALYSLLSNYDEELKEWYGLVASVQDIDTYYDVTEQYFEGMLRSAGIEGNESDLALAHFSALIADLKGEGSLTDFLQVEIAGETTVSDIKGASMGQNPALIEDGIVEFMKYRGPVQLGVKLIERFKDLDLANVFDSANKDEPIMEAKQEYAKAEGVMLEDMLYTYLAIRQYVNYYHNNDIPNQSKYQDYAENLSRIQEDFSQVTDIITKYYAATSGIRNLTAYTNAYGYFCRFNLPSTNNFNNDVTAIRTEFNGYTYTMSGIGAVAQTDEETGETYYILTPQKMRSLLQGIDDKISAIETAAQNIVSSCSGITSPNTDSDINPAIFCMKIQNTVSSSDINTIKNNGEALMQTYAKLLLAEWCDVMNASPLNAFGYEYDTSEDWATEIWDAKYKIEQCQKNYLSYSSAGTSYESLVNDYKSVADNTVNKVINRLYGFNSSYYDGSYVTVDAFLEKVRNEFQSLADMFNTQITNLDRAINGGTIKYNGKDYTVVSLDTLKVEIRNYTDAREDWHQAAENGDTDYAEAEREEYQKQEESRGKNPNEVNSTVIASLGGDGEQKVDELKTRLVNIRADMIAFRDALESFTYGGAKVSTLTLEGAITAATASVIPKTADGIGLSLQTAANNAVTYNKSLLSPAEGSVYTATPLKSGKTGNNPDLDTDEPDLLEYMDRALQGDKLDDALDKKEKNDEDKKKIDDASQTAQKEGKGFDSKYVEGIGKDPGEGRGGATYDALSAISGIVGVVKTIVDGNFTEFRDRLYVIEYAMDMFSYSDFNNEGRVRYSEKDLTSKLPDFENNTKSFSSQSTEKWNEQNTTELYENQSLTNRPITAEYNYSNLAEVEYILFGKATNKENLEACYGNIFAIRETLNLISGFQNFYSGASTTAQVIDAIAIGIQYGTMGIVPIPLTKVILISLMSILETAHDLKRLKAGIPVVLYKSKVDDWFIKVPTDGVSGVSMGDFLNSIKDGNIDNEPEDTNGLFYSDYLYLFLLLAAQNSSTYKGMLLRIGDLVEANVNLKTQSDQGFDLDKAKSYFMLTSKVEVKPLLITLPIVDSMDELDASTLRENTGWRTYSVSVIRGYS